VIRRLPPVSSRDCCSEAHALENVGVFFGVSRRSCGLLGPMEYI
jgi:hypothetical protein